MVLPPQIQITPYLIIIVVKRSVFLNSFCYINTMQTSSILLKNLIWQIEAGIDECIGETPLDRFSEMVPSLSERELNRPDQKFLSRLGDRDVGQLNQTLDYIQTSNKGDKLEVPEPPRSQNSATERAVKIAIDAAGAAKTIQELRLAVEAFEHCSLKTTAINTIFGVGNPESRIMFIGDVPGAEEDRGGQPFIGLDGKFLAQMLASIDLSVYYLTNMVFWRPPGDRVPTANEISVCRPFVERHIELVKPDILVLLGGPAAKALLGVKEGINKIRGQWFDYVTPKTALPIKVMPLYHPANVLRSPIHKKGVWYDLLEIKKQLG
jgi:DNA polymerase